MDTLVLIRVKNINDAKLLLKIGKRLGGAKLLKGEYPDDFYFAKKLDKGMKSANVSLKKVHRELRK